MDDLRANTVILMNWSDETKTTGWIEAVKDVTGMTNETCICWVAIVPDKDHSIFETYFRNDHGFDPIISSFNFYSVLPGHLHTYYPSYHSLWGCYCLNTPSICFHNCRSFSCFQTVFSFQVVSDYWPKAIIVCFYL